MSRPVKRRAKNTSSVGAVGGVLAFIGVVGVVVGIVLYGMARESLRHDQTVGVLAISIGSATVLTGFLLLGISDIVAELSRIRYLTEIITFDDSDNFRG